MEHLLESDRFFKLLVRIATQLGVDVPADDPEEFFVENDDWGDVPPEAALLLDRSHGIAAWDSDACARIAAWLDPIVTAWPDDDLKADGEALVAAMRACAASSDHLDLV